MSVRLCCWVSEQWQAKGWRWMWRRGTCKACPSPHWSLPDRPLRQTFPAVLSGKTECDQGPQRFKRHASHMIAKLMQDPSAAVWSHSCRLEWNTPVFSHIVTVFVWWICHNTDNRENNMSQLCRTKLSSSLAPLGKLVCINKGGNADIWSPLETLSCVSTKVPAANSSAHTDIIQISWDIFDFTALLQCLFVWVFGYHSFFTLPRRLLLFPAVILAPGCSKASSQAGWMLGSSLLKNDIKVMKCQSRLDMSVRALEHSGSVWALRSTDNAVLHFHLCCLHVRVWGSHLVFIFYQNVSIFVGGEPVAPPLVW